MRSSHVRDDDPLIGTSSAGCLLVVAIVRSFVVNLCIVKCISESTFKLLKLARKRRVVRRIYVTCMNTQCYDMTRSSFTRQSLGFARTPSSSSVVVSRRQSRTSSSSVVFACGRVRETTRRHRCRCRCQSRVGRIVVVLVFVVAHRWEWSRRPHRRRRRRPLGIMDC